MSQSQDIRRYPNGSIDLDFYRTGATALRRQAMRDTSVLKTAGAGLLMLVGTLAVVVVLAATLSPTPRDGVAVAQTSAPEAR